jgi:predicted transcriptional regulator
MFRKSLDDLGELQTAIMEMVWKLGEASVHQVRARLKRDPALAYTTVLSAMQKLEKAGWLRHRREGRTYVYRATRTRDQASTHSLRDFARRVFGGDAKLMFRSLLADDRLSDEDLAAIREMVERRRKERGDA